MFLVAAIAQALGGGVRAGGGSCPAGGLPPCTVDLHGGKAPFVSPACTSPLWSRFVFFTLPDKVDDSNGDGWWETVVAVDLDATRGCGCATFRVYFDDPFSKFAVDIGDSSTNNGYGGDEGTTFHEAEAQLAFGQLRVFSASKGRGAHAVDDLLRFDLPELGGRFVDLHICDQLFSFEMPPSPSQEKPLRFALQTESAGLLFDLTPSSPHAAGTMTRAREQGIYAGFNRVIHDKSGRPSPPARFGTGVRRVEIRLSP